MHLLHACTSCINITFIYIPQWSLKNLQNTHTRTWKKNIFPSKDKRVKNKANLLCVCSFVNGQHKLTNNQHWPTTWIFNRRWLNTGWNPPAERSHSSSLVLQFRRNKTRLWQIGHREGCFLQIGWLSGCCTALSGRRGYEARYWIKNKQLRLIWVWVLPSPSHQPLINQSILAHRDTQTYRDTHTRALEAAPSHTELQRLVVPVISASGSTLSTLIMQLNAALRIPAAAHPHYNTAFPDSLCVTNHRAFLPFSLHFPLLIVK